MGYGTGVFGAILGVPAAPYPPQVVSPLSSSRKIDGVTKRYVMNDEGGFEPMDDTDQRVLLTLSFADTDSKFITPQGLRSQEQKMRDALTANGLLDARAPSIQIVRLTVERSGSGEVTKTIVYKNLKSGTQKTVKR